MPRRSPALLRVNSAPSESPWRPPALASSRLRRAHPWARADAVHLKEHDACLPSGAHTGRGTTFEKSHGQELRGTIQPTVAAAAPHEGDRRQGCRWMWLAGSFAFEFTLSRGDCMAASGLVKSSPIRVCCARWRQHSTFKARRQDTLWRSQVNSEATYASCRIRLSATSLETSNIGNRTTWQFVPQLRSAIADNIDL